MTHPYFPTPAEQEAARVIPRALCPAARAELWIRHYWRDHPGCDHRRKPSIRQVRQNAHVSEWAAREAVVALRAGETR